jgi:hypothetical protein
MFSLTISAIGMARSSRRSIELFEVLSLAWDSIRVPGTLNKVIADSTRLLPEQLSTRVGFCGYL